MNPRALPIAIWLAALALCALQIARTPFTADLSAFLPASPDAGQRLLIDQLKSGVPARTLMVAIEGGSSAARGAASKQLGAALRASGLFEQVQNGAGDDWQATGHFIFERRYALSPAVEPARFSAAGLADAIDETLSLLGTPAGNALKDILERDPTGETQRIAEALIPASAPRTEDGVWVARRAPRALLLAVVGAEGADLDAQQAAMARIRGEFASLAAPGLTLRMSGTPLFSVDSRARIEQEVRWLAIAGTAVMSALLLVAFASASALVVAMLPVATGIGAGIAAVGLGFGSVHGITLGFGSTLVGEAVDYAIYYLIQARGGWRAWLAASWPTVRLGVLTSICGFAALVFSGFPGLAQLGVFSLAGLVAAAATTRWLLPALMPEGARGAGLRRRLGSASARLFAFLPATRWLWLALGLATAALLGFGPSPWRADLQSLSPVPREAIEFDQALRDDLRAADAGVLVVVTGADAEGTLQRAEAASARLETLVGRRVIGGFESISRLLPSVATQRRRIAALPAPAALQAALQQATRTGPLTAQRLAPFLAEVEAAKRRPPATPQTVAGTPLAPLVNTLLIARSGGGYAALLPVQPAGTTPIDAGAVAAALSDVPGARLLDIKLELDRLYAHYLDEAKAQALLGALAVMAIVAVALRSPRRVLGVGRPLLLAVLLTLGLLTVLGVPLGILHLVGLLLVVAIGSNYALFFDRPQLDADTLASLMLANVTTVLGFGLIALSEIPALSAIGRVVAPGGVLALVLAAAFAPRRAAEGE